MRSNGFTYNLKIREGFIGCIWGSFRRMGHPFSLIELSLISSHYRGDEACLMPFFIERATFSGSSNERSGPACF